MNNNNGAFSTKRLSELQKEFSNNEEYGRLQNALRHTKVQEVALKSSLVNSIDHSFSISLDDWKVTNQKASGRCWLFAGLNFFRVKAMKEMQLKDFEFSQNFAMFWDKVEKSNFFLENIMSTVDQDIDDREVAFLMSDPISDGGQWHMFTNIIKKYGAVPKAVMQETKSSSSTGAMNEILELKLRSTAMKLRTLHQNGASIEVLRHAKENAHGDIYRILCLHLGTPPQTFDWQWRDKDKKFHRDGEMTPRSFAEKYIGKNLDDYVCLVHDPRPENPPLINYTVKYLGNMVGGDPIIYLNTEIEQMKDAVIKSLQAEETVWMGCDVGKQMHGKTGLWDAELFDYEGLYNTDFELSKANRLKCGATLMTHAMLFTGVDLVDGKPRRWRVENSWGDEDGRGQKGFYTMNDSWFDEYMFEVVVHKKYISEKLLSKLDLEPKVLPAWDPMGALAYPAK